MATRTLKTKYEAGDDSVSRIRAILCHKEDAREVYYQFEDGLAAEDSTPEPVSVSAPAVVFQAPVATAPTLAAAATSIEDTPVKSLEILTVNITQKLAVNLFLKSWETLARKASAGRRKSDITL